MSRTRASAAELSFEEVNEACDLFLARTAGAGPAGIDERRALIEAVTDIASIAREVTVPVSPGPSPDLRLVVDGWMYRASILANGRRQITDIFLPGDLFDCSRKLGRPEEEIRACGTVRLANLRRDALTGRNWPLLERRWEWMRDAAACNLRSRLVSLGRRETRARAAHLMLELHDRLDEVALVDAGAFMCPLTQEQLADILGLTTVHINRVLQQLRRDGLVEIRRPCIVIHDLAELRTVAE